MVARLRRGALSVFADAVIWGSVLMAASGLGLLGDAIWQSVGGR